ncbi:siderophore-interacting protein [Rhizobium sp. C1]|uniref:siderophore-interacting protein n=1 Tax=Rhizobium sp. C1 TaxID=1349799 RepID=UPI001E3BF362|nr:siderophore-interacting protein [Rhizobium sp. C1]MCD2179543.1 siderophore-interacting protein [Rhizobium sp. C1]
MMTANFPTAFRLKARAKLVEPDQCLEHLVEHLREHDGEIREEEGAFLVTLPDIRGRMWCDDGLLHVDARSSDAETAYFVRTWLDGVFRHLAGTGPVEIAWKEDWNAGHLPPSFSVLKVEALQTITSRMMRVTLKCPDAARFARADALHVQVLVNFADMVAATGGAPAPLIWRRYTVRAVDLAASMIDIDIFLHGEAGPGAAWVRSLRVGDLVGVAGPNGGGIGQAERFLIAGDETALPAIARIMGLLPQHCVGDVWIETEESAERLPLEVPPGITLTWLARENDAGAALECAINGALARRTAEKTFVWVACEASAASRIRKHVRVAALHDNLDHLIAGYWKR